MNRIAPRLRVDIDALRHNYGEMQRLAPGAEVGASVKADGYGLGVGTVVPVLAEAGCRTFFVATPEEGREVRALAADADIYVLNGVSADDIGEAGLRPVLSCREAADMWAAEGGGRPCAVMFDTGMNRLGLPVADAARVAESGLNVVHVMSHLACANRVRHPMNAAQREAFDEVWPHFPGMTRSLANSGGVYLGADYHYDMVRPGIALYGGCATEGEQATRPVATLEATVLQVRMVETGESVGYDATFVAKRPTQVAVVGLGYADGFPVALSNCGWGRWRGERVSVVGRVSMDLTCLDIGDRDVRVGDEVEFLGEDLTETARAAGTIDYEILVRSRPRRRDGIG